MSSKFSRRPVIQQPPPVCKSLKKKIQIIFPPPPPPAPTELWITGTWTDRCSDGTFRTLNTTAKFVEPYPAPGGEYSFQVFFGEGTFRGRTYLSTPFEWNLMYMWDTQNWTATGFGYYEIPKSGPVDSGTQPAEHTDPLGRTSTFRIFSM